jgi:hypothetical protein
VTHNMCLRQGFRITVIFGDQEFSALNSLATVLSTAPCLYWAAASQHCGLIECIICFLKEKLCLLCHSLQSQQYRALWLSVWCFTSLNLQMNSLARVVSSTFLLVKSWWVVAYTRATSHCPLESLARLLKKFSHGTVLLHGCKLHSLGNLSGGQVFLALDTGYRIIRHQWDALPMPPTVIDCFNLLGRHERAMLIFTDRHGWDIGDYNPQDAVSVETLDDNLIIIHPAVEISGVDRYNYGPC